MGDRYDLAGVVFGLLVGLVLFAVGASVWLAIVFAAAGLNLSAFALRRRAGVPQATLWQRLGRRRHKVR
jgi:F0F1-type ATP synthase assembly protein I